MAVFGYLPKLKRDLGLAFGAHFLHEFSLFNTLSMDKVSCHTLFFLSKQWLTGRKRGEDGNTKI